ncbi:MAG: hypothetical protein IPN26_10715 [Bacteroidetes bacterium]|nr:hypothetical protein [Bacteroidota bacterium]
MKVIAFKSHLFIEELNKGSITLEQINQITQNEDAYYKSSSKCDRFILTVICVKLTTRSSFTNHHVMSPK